MDDYNDLNQVVDSAHPPQLADAQPSVGSKRKAPEAGQASSGTKDTAAEAPPAESPPLMLSELKRVEVRLFKGKLLVDIRELYKHAAAGELKPGTKGLALSLEQWSALVRAMPAVDAALAANATDYMLRLSQNRQLRVVMFKDHPRLDLREYYEKDGKTLPGKKGISLQPAEWQKLRAGDGAVVQASVRALQPLTAGRRIDSGAAAAAAPQTGSAAPHPEGQPGEDFSVSLATNRRVAVRLYNGKVLVDLRETYTKGGETLPGKKGIALSLEQFGALKGVANALTTALAASDTSFSHDLGNKRRAVIQVFKGTPRVSVREFYVKKGSTEQLPGTKGLDMTADQWQIFCDSLDVLDATAQQLAGA